jgi:hypothetical protein
MRVYFCGTTYCLYFQKSYSNKIRDIFLGSHLATTTLKWDSMSDFMKNYGRGNQSAPIRPGMSTKCISGQIIYNVYQIKNFCVFSIFLGIFFQN